MILSIVYSIQLDVLKENILNHLIEMVFSLREEDGLGSASILCSVGWTLTVGRVPPAKYILPKYIYTHFIPQKLHHNLIQECVQNYKNQQG